MAEIVAMPCVPGPQLGHLAVRGPPIDRAEDVGRARFFSADSFSPGPDDDGVAADRHGFAEPQGSGVGGPELGHLAIRGAAVGRSEDVD